MTTAGPDEPPRGDEARAPTIAKPGTPGGRHLVLDDIALDVAPGEFVPPLGGLRLMVERRVPRGRGLLVSR
ncbi:hypothetical protein HDA41_006992 [Streptomyces caelestis]|uniref:Uncharacterized protein n=1 Tax=Streptomyces caelestis TaxID=36816 RepID=A0A7W9HBV1_9ACTN|nr:hypothetical protein [Streptomyces caelestis]